MDSDEDDRFSFKDGTKLNPLDVIINDLISALDETDTIFKELLNLSSTPLGKYRNNVKNSADYFRSLRNNLGEDDMLDFLIIVTDYQNWHCDLGSKKVPTTLKNYRDRLEQHKREWMRKGIFDPCFVGREKEIEQIICNLTDNKDSRVSGVSVWGSGGIGKTTLANEICRLLWADSSHWQVIKIDLRRKETMGDLSKDLILKLLELQRIDDHRNPSEDLYNSLKDTMDRKLEATILDQLGEIKCRTIIMLDNVDDVFHKNKENFLKFVKNSLEKLQTEDCKVRVIITSRVDLLSGMTSSPFTLLIKSLEVKKLENHHAKRLIRKCTPKDLVSEDESNSLVILTEGVPLALRTICGTLGYLVKPAEVISHLKNSDAKKLFLFGMTNCLLESFDRLEDNMKKTLMQLTVFKTSSFDLQAANAVLQGDNVPPPTSLMTKINLHHLKSRHLIEIKDLTNQTEEYKVKNMKQRSQILGDVNRSELYSLHPLVFEFLSQLLSQLQSEFSNVMRSARIRFFEYMEKIISEIGEAQEEFLYNAESYLREYHIHIQSYFEIISEIRRDSENEAKMPSLVQSNRIFEIGKRTVLQEDQLAWLCWIIKRAEREKDNKMLFMFRGYYIQLLTEKGDIARIPGIIETTEKELVDQTPDKWSADMKKAVGNYYYRKAIYYRKRDKRNKILDSLQKAKKYLKEHCVSNDKIYTMILANVYNEFGCYHYSFNNDKCKKCHEKAIKIATSGVGREHPDVDMFRNNRAVCILKMLQDNTLDLESHQQHVKEALKHFDSTIAAGRRFGTDDTESHASALTFRSALHLELKEYAEARSDAEKCIEVRRKIVGERHDYLTLSYGHLARVLYNWGDQMIRESETAEGMKLLEESASHYDKTFDMMKKGKNGEKTTLSHDQYYGIKKFHLLAVERTQYWRELEQEYLEFERDTFRDSDELKRDIGISTSDASSVGTSSSSSEDENSDSPEEGRTKTCHEILVDVQKTSDNTPTFTAQKTAPDPRTNDSDSATPRHTEQADMMASHVPINEESQGDTSKHSSLSVKLTGKRMSQRDEENPPIPAKVTKEDRCQEGTANPPIPAKPEKEDRGQEGNSKYLNASQGHK